MNTTNTLNAEKTIIKTISNTSESGYLSNDTRKELHDAKANTGEGTGAAPTLAEMRAAMGWKSAHYTPKHSLEIKNLIADQSVPVRLYRRKDLTQAVPTLIFLHGGGFFGGSLDNVEYPCRALADLGECMILSVDYSLAPEKPYPNGLLDCYRVVKWVYEQADELNVFSDKIAVAGDSAGGNLSLTTSLLDRTLGTNYISAEVLAYPTTILGTTLEDDIWDIDKWGIKDSEKEMIANYIRSFGDSNQLVDSMYTRDFRYSEEIPFISPYYADQLNQLPPTCMIIGEFDPLRIAGEAMVEKLREANVDVTYYRYNGMSHAFMDKVGDYEQALDMLKETINFVQAIFNQ